jgi:hypothetical protein
MLSSVSASTTMLFWVIFLLPYSEHDRTNSVNTKFEKSALLHYYNTEEPCSHLLRSWSLKSCKSKAIPLQAWTGPEGSRRVRLPDVKTIGTWMWQGCQPDAPATFSPTKYSWYSFLLEAESTPGP